MIIYKYELEIRENQWVDLPYGAQLLSVGEQNGKLFVWARVDRERQGDAILFRIYGTGLLFELDPGRFLGTVQMQNGLVWHVYCADDTSNQTVR